MFTIWINFRHIKSLVLIQTEFIIPHFSVHYSLSSTFIQTCNWKVHQIFYKQKIWINPKNKKILKVKEIFFWWSVNKCDISLVICAPYLAIFSTDSIQSPSKQSFLKKWRKLAWNNSVYRCFVLTVHFKTHFMSIL